MKQSNSEFHDTNVRKPRARLFVATLACLSTLALSVACSSGSGSGGNAESETGKQTSPDISSPWPPDSPKPSQGEASNPAYKPRGLSAKVFESGGRTYAPMDIQDQNLTLTFDARAGTTTGRSTITFKMNTTARPTFLLDGTIRDIKLNGQTVSSSRVESPGGYDALVGLGTEVNEGTTAVVDLTYTLASDRASYTSGKVGFLTDMADTIARFFERWGPANYEDDSFAMTLNLKTVNATGTHRVFANGQVTQVSPTEWQIRYPSHYTSTSFFAHLTGRSLVVNTFNVQGMERTIPVTVYSSDATLVTSATRNLPGLFRDIEGTYGPYPHPGFIAYVGPTSGGMEYVGATITSARSLSHELFHSWFARGVMPAEGRSGWIDEAIASWRDHGYERATSLLKRSTTNLGHFSGFRRATPTNSYADGRALLGEWDLLFASTGGLKPILKAFYEKYRYTKVTSDELQAFLEERTGADLDPYFVRYVHNGISAAPQDDTPDSVQADPDEIRDSLHPTPLTDKEVDDLR